MVTECLVSTSVCYIWSKMQSDFLPNFILCNTTQQFIRSSKLLLFLFKNHHTTFGWMEFLFHSALIPHATVKQLFGSPFR
ncbi:hypothetical protein ES332_D11G293500v1 [Gossypium tomentosum]|uniref:Uncharacterized protein n=1 Tax=Gossypium tomentosum TaxID=34277 RepID=A0A5D2ITX2_GOSTO|nr:hypothetical protein ES332_D11G293500v1 [Gossypium tomentosum]